MGFDDEARRFYDLSDIINQNHEHESFGTGSILNSHNKGTELADHENEVCICDRALLNASNKHYFNVKKNFLYSAFLYSAVVNITNIEMGMAFGFPISHQIKAEYTPPDLFLSNSCLLL